MQVTFQRLRSFSVSSEEEKAQRKAKQEAEAREANRRQCERRLGVVEQRALAEQRAVLCEAELTVTKPADSSLGASFIDASNRRELSVKLHMPRPSGPLADAGGAEMMGAIVVMVNGEAVKSTAHLERLVLPLERVTLTLALREPRRVAVCGDCDQLVLPSLAPLGPGSGSSLLREEPGSNRILTVLDLE